MKDLVSIIIPCYNQGVYLSETLYSVQEQTYHNWECIIMDDGSTDDTHKVAIRYTQNDDRFHYYYQKNQGVSVTRNNAIIKAKGQYILPLDADDIIDGTYVQKAIGVFTLHPETKLVYCKARYFGAKNESWSLKEYSYDLILWENLIFCSAMFRKKDFEATKGFNENMRNGLEDWDFWLTFLKKEDHVCRIDEELFFYRLHEKSRTNMAQDNIHILTKQIFINHIELYRPYIQDLLYYRYSWTECQNENKRLHNELEKRIHSSAYRLGRFLLSPIYLIKNCCGIYSRSKL